MKYIPILILFLFFLSSCATMPEEEVEPVKKICIREVPKNYYHSETEFFWIESCDPNFTIKNILYGKWNIEITKYLEECENTKILGQLNIIDISGPFVLNLELSEMGVQWAQGMTFYHIRVYNYTDSEKSFLIDFRIPEDNEPFLPEWIEEDDWEEEESDPPPRKPPKTSSGKRLV